MIFADGENLVVRYQAMISTGRVPSDDISHIPDILVWHRSFSGLVTMEEVIRATYYTYVVGDDLKVQKVREEIRKLQFTAHRNSTLPRTLMPKVFKKPSRSVSGKGVDIEMTVDVLTNVHESNVDMILLLSGDGDYVPLIREVQRCGKQCYVSAFSDGLNSELPLIADKFYCLDNCAFKSEPPKAP